MNSSDESLRKHVATLLESYQDPRLPQTVRATPAPAAKPNLSFNGSNCSTAKTHRTLFSESQPPENRSSCLALKPVQQTVEASKAVGLQPTSQGRSSIGCR